MPAQPCANHPKEMTLVRCGRCERPICVRCMVDTPVGKKCRPCAENRTHLAESNVQQVLLAFVVTSAVAVVTGWMVQQSNIYILAVPWGWLLGEVALRAGQRRRSVAIQVVTGLAALVGGLIGAVFIFGHLDPDTGRQSTTGLHWEQLGLGHGGLFRLAVAGVGAAIAVSRVRFL